MPKISPAKLAEKLGISREAVNKALKKKQIKSAKKVKNRWQIDEKKGIAEYRENVKQATLTSTVSNAHHKPPAHTEPTPGLDYNKSRTVRETYNAKLAKLEYDEKVGTVVNAHEVKSAAYQTAATLKGALLNIPSRVSAIIAAETDQHKISIILTEEIERALEELNRSLKNAATPKKR